MVLRKSFYIRWSAGRSPRVHEVNPGRDPSLNTRYFENWTELKADRKIVRTSLKDKFSL